MKFHCIKHGEVEAEPNENHDVFCPRCYAEKLKESLPKGYKAHTDKDGNLQYLTAPYVPLQVSKMRVNKDGSISMSSRWCKPDECTCKFDNNEEIEPDVHKRYCPKHKDNK